MSRILFSCMLMAVCAPALAADLPEFQLTIRNQAFEPAQLKVPANTKFKLLVKNADNTPSEFESTDMNREKIVLPNSTISVYIGPLNKGSYTFFDDFHQDTGKGVLTAE